MTEPKFKLGDQVETIKGDRRFIVNDMRWNGKTWSYQASYAGAVEEKLLLVSGANEERIRRLP